MVEAKERDDATTLNVVVLPSEAVSDTARRLSEGLAKQFPTEFTLNSTTFRPHITLYQGYFPNGNIDALTASLQEIAEDCKKFVLGMGEFYVSPGRFVWWNTEKSSYIYGLHETILNAANPLREGLIAPATQQQLEELGERERENVIKTGLIYSGELYVPHVTLTRLTKASDMIPAHQALGEREEGSFTIDKIVLAKMGDHGTISDTLSEFAIG